jgi:hypothetical protein
MEAPSVQAGSSGPTRAWGIPGLPAMCDLDSKPSRGPSRSWGPAEPDEGVGRSPSSGHRPAARRGPESSEPVWATNGRPSNELPERSLPPPDTSVGESPSAQEPPAERSVRNPIGRDQLRPRAADTSGQSLVSAMAPENTGPPIPGASRRRPCPVPGPMCPSTAGPARAGACRSFCFEAGSPTECTQIDVAEAQGRFVRELASAFRLVT